MTASWQTWLRTQEGLKLVQRCLGQTDRQLDDEILSFWEYLAHRTGKTAVVLNDLIFRQDWTGLERKIRSMYRLFLAEKNRDLLYQRVRQVLSAADKSYGYQPGDKFSWYGAQEPCATQVGEYEQLRAAGFAPQCPDLHTKDIRTSQGLLLLAASFRDQLATFQGQDCRIPLRTLCDFIREQFDLRPIPTGVDQSTTTVFWTEGAAEKEGGECWDMSSHASALADNYISAATRRFGSCWWPSEEFLQQFAQAVAHQLERESLLLVICLLVYCDLTMAQTAKILGYAGPSGVAAIYKRAQARIEEASSLLEGLSADDLDSDMFQYFLGLLLQSCTESDCSR